MIQICRKDKEKVYEAIRSGKIDAAEMSFPNLIDDILLTLKRRGLTDLLAGVRHFLLPKNFLKPYFRLIILSNFPYFYVVCAVCI